jgi:arginyl-tRNA synthetase
METLLALFKRETSKAISSAFQLSPDLAHADVSLCAQEEFGHYQCNTALRLGAALKQNPRTVAQKIVDHFEGAMCSKIEIAGPGFINFTLSADYLSRSLEAQLKDPLLGASSPRHKQKIIVEFSSPNVAKELHVGHIRSTIIGDCLARLFEFLKQDVLRLNHIGDWGTQFGMLIAYILEFEPGILERQKDVTLETLMQWYRASKERFDRDPEFKKKSQLEVVRLQSGAEDSLRLWQWICQVSRKGFQEIYDLLGVHIVERGESFYNPQLKGTVEALDQQGLVTLSNGAKCIFLEGFKNREGEPLPMIIQKSDGGYNYDTTDLAALHHRIFIEKADRIIYITDIGQSLHFQMLFAAAKKAGWLEGKTVALDHVGFGLVLGPDGKKFKTRSGATEKLIDLLTEAVARAQTMVQERLPDASSEEKTHLAHVLGIGALKYADLSSCRTKDYTFSYDRMLRFDGNTAVFLLYAYVRINGIKKKVGADMGALLRELKIEIEHVSELSLALHLRRFGEVLEMAASDLMPHHLTDYLYLLAEKFNAFFRDCRVEGSDKEKSRLLLCELTSRLLRQGLAILGLETVERM